MVSTFGLSNMTTKIVFLRTKSKICVCVTETVMMD